MKELVSMLPIFNLNAYLKIIFKVNIDIENLTRRVSSTFNFSGLHFHELVPHCGFNFYFPWLLIGVSIFS